MKQRCNRLCPTRRGQALLLIGITGRSDEISYGSGYAHHPIGGILRRVELVALPSIHIQTLRVFTDLDNE